MNEIGHHRMDWWMDATGGDGLDAIGRDRGDAMCRRGDGYMSKVPEAVVDLNSTS